MKNSRCEDKLKFREESRNILLKKPFYDINNY